MPNKSGFRRVLLRMTYDHSRRRYRHWYAKLLRLYPKPYYDRFGEGMEQTFNDLFRERAEEERGLSAFALWMFVETSAGIVRENVTLVIMQNITKRLSVWAIVVAAVLTIPVLAKWPWTGGDFAFGAVVLFGSALVYELLARTSGNSAYRFAVGIAVASSLVLFWINAAVGIIGDGPVNLMYFGVLSIGFIGALIARFKPHGMARTLFAMAFAQIAVPAIALMIWKAGWQDLLTHRNSPHPPFHPGIAPVFVLNGMFAMLFVGSAFLFRRASDSAPT